MIAALDSIRSSLASAHRLIIVAQSEPGHSPTEDALIDAVRCLATVAAGLIDICEALLEPMTDAEFLLRTMEKK